MSLTPINLSTLFTNWIIKLFDKLNAIEFINKTNLTYNFI